MNETLTFIEWLACYELMTEKEFADKPKYKQDNYLSEYEMWKNGESQYNHLK